MALGKYAGMAALLCCGLAAAPARADDLRLLIDDMLRTNDRLVGAEADVEGARNSIEVARGGWYPTLTPTVNYGYEKQNKPSGSDDTAAYRNEYSASLKQLVWDFGATNSTIGRAEATHKQAESTREGTRQGLMLEAVTAYANLTRTLRQLSFARESEANIRRQTGLEEAKVDLGSGLSSDVLQAKTQLAGAQANRIQSEFALAQAQNRFRNIFNKPMEDAASMVLPKVPLDRLPATLTDALAIARANSPSIKVATHAVEAARRQMEATKAQGFFPKVELVGEAKNKRNISGTMGAQQEYLAKVEVSMPINLGMTAVNSLKASESGVVAAERRLAAGRDQTEEQVGNAWENYVHQKARAEMLGNQAVLANEFLELARKERQLGNRSLIDVLAGETALIGAQSQAASAQADVVIAAYTVLAVIGSMEPDAIR
ncbi:TolC family outer membrane protein [Magnetospirillum sp. SS-4]|uniref:TolC family outer membrane protein n=1 Tax=Magnetospirillum sp. SS-4 TaxID=2681465 RepID=UPI001383237F|nr:TolC family outer membrane protein [Magnetospirillum sp. SS-4]CAA7613032.1 Outer membrane efflux protein [Magnetospirillum sp. SS-4]